MGEHAGAPEWKVVLEDSFQPGGGTPTGLDPATWTFDVGDRDMSDPANPGPERWGNGEPQWYTDRPHNVQVLTIEDFSFLQITARSEAFKEGFGYTSGRIHTRNHPVAGRIMPPKNGDGSWVDGGAVRVEARLKLPQGTPSGTWPAFWMLPTDKVYGGWPFSGEVDIMEVVGPQTKITHALHFGGPWNRCTSTTDEFSWPALPDSEMWRTIALEWAVHYEGDVPKMTLAWFIDGKQSKKVSSDDWFCNSCTDTCEDGTPVKLDKPLAPFDQPFHVILNLAVGGTNGFAGLPPEGPYLQFIMIDYVKISQRG